MNRKDWSDAWELFIAKPVPFGLVLATLVLFFAWLAWHLRGFRHNQLIVVLDAEKNTIEQRLRFAEDREKDIKDRYEFDLKKLNTQVDEQIAIISELKKIPGTAKQVERLSHANTEITNSLSNLAETTSTLMTLSGSVGLSADGKVVRGPTHVYLPPRDLTCKSNE